jgi:hypothetical protein
MRNLLLAPVLASFVLSSAPADACGPYMQEPTIFKLSTHHRGTQVTGLVTRTFVLTGAIDQAQADQMSWQRLGVMSFDLARFATAPDLATPMDVTLIGPGGTKVVSSKRRGFLEGGFEERKPSSALEIEGLGAHRFTFALKGRHANAKWIAVGDNQAASSADLAWVKKHGVKPVSPEYVYVAKLAGTELELVSVLAENTGVVTLVRSGNHDLYTRFDGSSPGAFQLNGQRYVLASLDGAVTAVWL